MEHFGFWGLIPPILTIVLAFLTKDVIISLFTGIFIGALFVAHGNPIEAILNITDSIAGNLSDGWNIRILLFCALLGGLVGLMTKTGATNAFGDWARKKIQTKKTGALMAWFCGILIFIDDYFNSLAVGTIMRPITDKTGMSRAKLAWILDSTAAPVCIIVPISSWVVTVMSILKDSQGFETLDMTPLSFFVHLIPYNVYAFLTLIMILVITLTEWDWGPMAKAERMAKDGVLFDISYGDAPGSMEETDASRRVGPIDVTTTSEGEARGYKRARVVDMLFPILFLIVICVVMFPVSSYLSVLSSGEVASFGEAVSSMSLGDAFNNADASVALFYAIVITLTVTYLYYLIRRLFDIKEASTALMDGIKTMMPALIILALAWTIGGVIKNSPEDGGLGLSRYLSDVFVRGNFPLSLLPFLVFVVSALIAFSTGTSWGTFAIMIPITFPIAAGLASNLGLEGSAYLNACSISVAAVLGGAVFGDHTSPISDTTILSSTGAGCPHLQHVATQIPYAVTVAVVSCLALLVGGLAHCSIIITWIVALLSLAVALFLLPKVWKKE